LEQSSSDSAGTSNEFGAAGKVIAVAVNNTNTSVALVEKLGVTRATSIPSDQPDQIAKAAADLLDSDPEIVLLASVNDSATPAVADALRHMTGLQIQQLGPDFPVPIAHTLPEPVTTGLDRFLVALGAFAVVGQACVVVDAGTAITCDFVDGQGVFHGGAIIAGGQMMLDALPAKAPALPNLNLADMPNPLEPFGKSTDHAMLLGVQAAARGAVRYLAERYAGFYEAYPQVIATGGNARLLFEDDDLVESIVPDLQLIGIGAARSRLIGKDSNETGDDT
jgi:type III pantothenate kinase